MRTAAWICLTLLVAAPLSGAGTVYYSFFDSQKGAGGVARIDIDSATGAVKKHEAMYVNEKCVAPFKLIVNDAGTRLLLTREVDGSKDANNVLLFDLSVASPQPDVLKFPSTPESTHGRGDLGLIEGGKGTLMAIDLARNEIVGTFKARDQLKPPASSAAELRMLDDASAVLVSYQKDSDKYEGNRIVALSMPKLDLIADVRLPRTHAELHREGNAKESGPNPDQVLVSASTNTVLVTVEHYGAVALIDLDKLLKGKVLEADVKYVSTAADGAFGQSFPESVIALPSPGGDRALVFNSGKDGGACVFDLKERKLLHHVACPPGIERPELLAASHTVVGVVTGKKKLRGDNGTISATDPADALAIFDLSPLDKGGAPTFSATSIGNKPRRMHALDEKAGSLVLIVLESAVKSRMIVYDVAAKKQVGAFDALGELRHSAYVP